MHASRYGNGAAVAAEFKEQRVRPIINEILQSKGLVSVAEDRTYVTGLKGPLEEGWQKKAEAFATRIPASPGSEVP